jgi:capsular exopolysaccharide synthesis family protein
MSRIDEARRRNGSPGLFTNAQGAVRNALETFPAVADPASPTPPAAPPVQAAAPPAQAAAPAVRPPEPAAPQAAEPPSRPVLPAAQRSIDELGWPGEEKLVVNHQMPRLQIEQYRRLAAALHNAQQQRGIKIVMIASAQVGEGKTLTSANLSLTLSESYRRRVLLVDADLRRPALDSLFHTRHIAGLSQSLRAGETAPLRIVPVSECLTLMPAGRPEDDPMAVLTSERMRRVLQQASMKFDWVILDTPPTALMSDARLLNSMVDGIVLVVHAGVTPYPLVRKTIELLGAEKILGVVLNRVDDSAMTDAGYYGYGHRTRQQGTENRWSSDSTNRLFGTR